MKSRLRFFLQGMVTVCITGKQKEGVFSACLKEGVAVAALQGFPSSQKEEALALTLAAKDYPRLRPLLRKIGCKSRIIQKYGLPFLLWPYRKRGGFFGGVLLFLLLILFFGQFIWVVEPQGNSLVSSQKILSVAESVGVGVGRAPETEKLTSLEQAALLQLSDLSWLVFNKSGSRMQIAVTERITPNRPEKEEAPSHIVADCDGVLVGQEVFSGRATHQIGEAFVAGEILVSAYLYGANNVNQIVPAKARLQARVTKDFSVRLPLSIPVQELEGRGKGALVVQIFGKQFSFGPFDPPEGYFTQKFLQKSISWQGDRLPFGFAYLLHKEDLVTAKKRSREEALCEGYWRLSVAMKKFMGEEGILEEVVYEEETAENAVLLTARAVFLLFVGEKEAADPAVPPVTQNDN